MSSQRGENKQQMVLSTDNWLFMTEGENDRHSADWTLAPSDSLRSDSRLLHPDSRMIFTLSQECSTLAPDEWAPGGRLPVASVNHSSEPTVCVESLGGMNGDTTLHYPTLPSASIAVIVCGACVQCWCRGQCWQVGLLGTPGGYHYGFSPG